MPLRTSHCLLDSFSRNRHHPACPGDPFSTFWGHEGYVYILASKKNGTLYTGVTSNPSRRLLENVHELTPRFTSRYGVKTLVWLEVHDLVVDAIRREKAIKKYPRQWKINLIETVNPDWADLSAWLLDV